MAKKTRNRQSENRCHMQPKSGIKGGGIKRMAARKISVALAVNGMELFYDVFVRVHYYAGKIA